MKMVDTTVRLKNVLQLLIMSALRVRGTYMQKKRGGKERC